MRADNFGLADLPELMSWLHQRGVRGYLTLNTLIFPAELPEVEQYLKAVIAAGVDAVIVQDIGLCRLIRHLSPDFPIHASTQMTITSSRGVEFAQDLGCNLVVLARECSLKEIGKIQQYLAAADRPVPLEVFVHGALCVAYSGQCLTSEALGGRSANRGECAQACRMPYELIVDGQVLDLGDRRYLLSPQDLSGVEVLPELVRAGVRCLKIEGRLKTPEYVAAVTQVYRQALDRVWDEAQDYVVSPQERYQLEMSFSRGLFSGWFQGIDNQALVHARYGKKRGVFLGEIQRVDSRGVQLRFQAALQAGDGVVFDTGRQEVGGRVYGVEAQGDLAWVRFGREFALKALRPGQPCWKTSDPALDKVIRQTYASEQPQFQRPLHLEVYGGVGEPLRAIARDESGHSVEAVSSLPLVAAEQRPLTTQRLREQFGRLGNTPFCLGALTNHLQGELMLPVSELNRLRRSLVEQLLTQRAQPQPWHVQPQASFTDLLPEVPARSASPEAELSVLIRSPAQLEAALACNVTTLYAELEDPRRYRELVQQFRALAQPQQELWLAPPRISKPSENWMLDQVRRAEADGYLVRNYDHLHALAGERLRGDFSLNVANPLTAAYFRQGYGLERLTASYDLNAQQLVDLLRSTPPDWLEVTLHQHMPMFHMEHCVFCAFLSEGKDFTDCGRPCERHQVKLRDRTGTEHLLQVDAGCRNTLFNGVAQTGAESVPALLAAGLRYVRLDFLQEPADLVQRTIQRYQQLLRGELRGQQLWQELRLQSQLGVTRGSLG
jgi:putative protease